MSFIIHLYQSPVPSDYPVHPGLGGYLAILHDEDLEKTVYVGFLAPHNLLPQTRGPFLGTARLLSWLTRGVAIHDHQVNHDTLQWLDRAVAQPSASRPVILMRDLSDVDDIDWPPNTTLADLRALAEADLEAMDLLACVDAANADEPESATRF